MTTTTTLQQQQQNKKKQQREGATTDQNNNDIEYQHEGSPLMNAAERSSVTSHQHQKHLSFDGGNRDSIIDESYRSLMSLDGKRRFLIGSGIVLVAVVLLFQWTYYNDVSSSPPSSSASTIVHHHHTGSSSLSSTNNNNKYDNNKPTVSVAFVGNSMFYFNDFPRFLQRLSNHQYRFIQDSCLHGGASIASLVDEGNAMYPNFDTGPAIIIEDEVIDNNNNVTIIHDYGACTVQQLLIGWDDRLDDPGYAQPMSEPNNPLKQNPCRVDPPYLRWTIDHYNKTQQQHNNQQRSSSSSWDYVLMNDNTKNPARASTRALAVQTLERFYVPWLLQTNATPVFLWTHAYDNSHPVCINNMTTGQQINDGPTPPAINMTRYGLQDIANFTSLTRVGYQAYVDILKLYLPKHQTPIIAPVGLAFLLVHEENYDLWTTLFHCDHLHASPSGSFLQGMVVYYTLFGHMPDKEWVITNRMEMSTLWNHARMMQHSWEPSNPFPSHETAIYLYNVAERIMKYGYVPKSYIHYTNGEVAYEQPPPTSAYTYIGGNAL